MTEDEMVQWHHQLDGHEFEQALGVGDGQGGLECCSQWGHKGSDTTEQLNNNVGTGPETSILPPQRQLNKSHSRALAAVQLSAESELVDV